MAAGGCVDGIAVVAVGVAGDAGGVVVDVCGATAAGSAAKLHTVHKVGNKNRTKDTGTLPNLFVSIDSAIASFLFGFSF